MVFKTTYRPPGKYVYVQVIAEQQQSQMRYAVISAGKTTPEWTVVETAAELVKKAGKSLPYILHFRGFGVLTRIAENVPGYKESLLVNGHVEDFCFSSMEYRGTVGVAFMRVSLLQSFLDELQSLKAFVWAIHTGPVPLLALMDKENGEARLDFSIAVKSGELRTFERNQETVKPIPGTFYTEDEAYAAAVLMIAQEQPEAYSDGLPEEARETVRSDYKEFMRFVKLGVGMLSLFFLLLVGNYFYVNFLNNKAAQLEADIAGFGEDLALIDRLEQEKARKTVLVDNSGLQSERFLTFYLDEIGASVPASIQLETLDAFPLKEALKPKRKVELNRETVTVTGFSSSSKVLDDWMEVLEQKKWINGVELMNYVRINDHKATFNLLIRIRS